MAWAQCRSRRGGGVAQCRSEEGRKWVVRWRVKNVCSALMAQSYVVLPPTVRVRAYCTLPHTSRLSWAMEMSSLGLSAGLRQWEAAPQPLCHGYLKT